VKQQMTEEANSSEIVAEAKEVIAKCRIPRATYRLQLNRELRFRDVTALVPYLDALGISDVYLSPIVQACAGSSHGYDICNHNRINPELGDENALRELSAELQRHGMGLILDVVPNHMGIRDVCNAWWMDVLENGPSSVHAHYFDIDWRPVKRELRNKVLLPILEDQYGKTLESGKLRLVFEAGSFYIRYYETILPLAPRTYSDILSHALDLLSESLSPDHPHLQELQSILTALSYLPPRTELDPGKIAERSREKEIVKRRIGSLYNASPEVKLALDDTVQEFNGVVGEPRSFDNLDALLDKQVYRPAFWKVAAEEINYRRFFDINDLAAIRMEDPEVFRAAHELLLDLMIKGVVTGLRIDHADGLWDPTAYLHQVQYSYLRRAVEARLAGSISRDIGAVLTDWFAAQCESSPDQPRRWPVYLVVEKILSMGEPLPKPWAAHGTTGYDFLNAVNGLFVDQAQREEISRVYASFTGSQISFDALVNSTKKMIMLVSLASEVYSLSHRLDSISEKNRRYRDFTLDSLTFGIREVIASLGVYRTYISGPDFIPQRDREYVEAAVADAKRRNPRTPEALFDFIRDTLLLRNLKDFRKPDRTALIDWVMKFQQITGPVMAKGVEDTAFYVYNRLVSLNEVGGDPLRFGLRAEEFHRQNSARFLRWPHSMLASSTHDTKRCEDVRARINVLSEIPGEWSRVLSRWRSLNASKKSAVDGIPAPDENDEYLFYQTLLGAWPIGAERASDSFVGRVRAYMQKTIKEAKVHTSWVNPNKRYDEAVDAFVTNVLGDNEFLSDLLPFQKRVDRYGRYNALSQLLLKLTCPGVPDTYQGSELWDLRLVDPDNRRPVDYKVRNAHLAALKARLEAEPSGLRNLATELLESSADGRIKMFVILRTLSLRREHPEPFSEWDYDPLEAIGPRSGHICAFQRSRGAGRLVVAVPRLVVGLTGGVERHPLGEEVWLDTKLILPAGPPAGTYRSVFTGEEFRVQEHEGLTGMSLASLFDCFPVALLEACS
jgi:(1->4)-alpha-D-glucan 1-alpha-D-glucosylmutase